MFTENLQPPLNHHGSFTLNDGAMLLQLSNSTPLPFFTVFPFLPPSLFCSPDKHSYSLENIQISTLFPLLARPATHLFMHHASAKVPCQDKV